MLPRGHDGAVLFQRGERVMICSVDGCTKKTHGRGLCHAHLNRWRKHGDPLGGGTKRGEPERFYREVVLPYRGDDCLLWPYSLTVAGYGQLRSTKGRTQLVSRRVCEDTHGAAPSPHHEAAHSCGRGQFACVAPNHVSWKTPAENTADKIAHGTYHFGEKHGLSKLTESQVLQIRCSQGKQTEIAGRFGITQQTVSDIHRGETWAWLEDRP
jgi:hypothetical protein